MIFRKPRRPMPSERVAEATDSDAFLRALLIARGPRAQAAGLGSDEIARLCERVADPTFGSLVQDAEYHGVTALIEPAIKAMAAADSDRLPEHVRLGVFALASRHRHAAAIREECVDELLLAFGEADIRLILLKGAALAHSVYPAPGLRPMFDIDVLVDRADQGRAVALVRSLGYVFAPAHDNLTGPMHHLPVARTTRAGFRVMIELHTDTMSPNTGDSLTARSLTSEPRRVARDTGPAGLALGHTDMLRHLARHAFEPADRIRLIHLYDVWLYRTRFDEEIDWRHIAGRYPQVVVALQLVAGFFSQQPLQGSPSARFSACPVGAGRGMVPLSEIAAADWSGWAKLSALFHPPAWWLHGFYGVPPDRSLLACRTVRHPLTVARWLQRRWRTLIALRSGHWCRSAGAVLKREG